MQKKKKNWIVLKHDHTKTSKDLESYNGHRIIMKGLNLAGNLVVNHGLSLILSVNFARLVCFSPLQMNISS